jgi:ubiquitin C-terminal hydrolase
MALRPYDAAFAPAAFGLHNTGVICHFNSLLQGLASCPILIKTVLENAEYMSKTITGKAFYTFVSMIAGKDGAKAVPDQSIGTQSSKVLHAFVTDLRARRPSVEFGSSQECANEGLVLLLDMIEPPDETEAKKEAPTSESTAKPRDNPISRLFLHRYKCEVYCDCCKTLTSSVTDLSVQFSVGYMDRMRVKPQSVQVFSDSLVRVVSVTEDFYCSVCAKKVKAYRIYRLAMIPEIAVCLFNIYDPPRPARSIPDSLLIPAIDGKHMKFRQVAAAEQTGDRNGGHYTARGLRHGGRVCYFNDSNVPSPCSFNPTRGNENKYLVFYNFDGIVSPPSAPPVQKSDAAPPPDAVSDIISRIEATSI